MTMIHSEPNRATPATHLWFAVETPNIFREHKLRACSADWSRAEQRKFAELERLAEAHGTYVQRNSYRRG